MFIRTITIRRLTVLLKYRVYLSLLMFTILEIMLAHVLNCKIRLRYNPVGWRILIGIKMSGYRPNNQILQRIQQKCHRWQLLNYVTINVWERRMRLLRNSNSTVCCKGLL